ncbi:uncharacterized protein LOC115959464 [Quercus lobata]|uniref:Uncharacterized protein n=1 Tax=Quercus lobata TaxID=97700 RepID=A0A7N2MHA7_QUELO|nr:uncharacterized protein LOC115959464 [Quercus lobata]XP_030933735.1 uncharacterized protein LOC115959464 [Quercus lobata]XP_030933736.1 uncharacterized protein LOC115959464 [Quercus lobata]XP_030933737.1 uncharacterized protein LOC115959464 [Quercus lobata]XP_030933738.1 uncharacterized protein LOC115959464 [Quercus lobata]XP_030933740.1 uncharacterized protein LOC115959464 [Quercus lobata]XP_030933741.1 uncharacterized protein LOC115959464 [Quercus lobata]XP_030933742.1 uncharacterized p
MLRAKQIRLVQEEEKKKKKDMEEQQKIERDKRVHRRNREGTKLLLPEKCQYNKKNQPKAQDKQASFPPSLKLHQMKSSPEQNTFSHSPQNTEDFASMNLTEKDEGKRVQEAEEQGDDEDIFAKAHAVLENLETSIPSASSNMDSVKLNETLLCIRSYLVNSVDEVLLDDVAQGRFYELCQSILPYMHKEDGIEGPILSMFMDQYENSVKDLSQIRDRRDRIEALNHIISHTPDPRAAFKIQVADALQDLTTASNELMQAEQELCKAQAKVNRCVQKKNEAKAFVDGLLQQNEEVSRQSESLSRSEEEMKNLTIEVVFTEEKIRNNWSLIRSMLDNFQFEE